MANEKFVLIGGQRGGGKIFHLEKMLALTKVQLLEAKQDLERWKSAALYYREKAVTSNKWIPASDVLPTEKDADSQECVLVHTANNENLIIHYEEVRRFREFILYWMPLPEPPKE